MEWNTDYNGVSVNYAEHLVRIQTDAQLLRFLGGPGNDSLNLASHIKNTYQLMFGKELNISEKSLSVEILVHAYLDVLLRSGSELSKRLSPKVFKDFIACMERMKGQTKIIDCGEKEIDPNRHVFDSLASYRYIIYAVLGKRA